MTLPRTVSDVVAEHVTFEVECIDREANGAQGRPASGEGLDAFVQKRAPRWSDPGTCPRPRDRSAPTPTGITE